jgi:hypothetical protein
VNRVLVRVISFVVRRDWSVGAAINSRCCGRAGSRLSQEQGFPDLGAGASRQRELRIVEVRSPLPTFLRFRRRQGQGGYARHLGSRGGGTATSPATVPRQVTWQVTWGLLAAWAVHDLEELCTLAPSSRRIVARLRSRYPQIPGGVWERLEFSPAHAAVAIGMMGGRGGRGGRRRAQRRTLRLLPGSPRRLRLARRRAPRSGSRGRWLRARGGDRTGGRGALLGVGVAAAARRGGPG